MPKLKYIPIEKLYSLYFDEESWGSVTSIVPCTRCGSLTEDPTRDIYGGMMPDHFISEEDLNPICQRCSLKYSLYSKRSWGCRRKTVVP